MIFPRAFRRKRPPPLSADIKEASGRNRGSSALTAVHAGGSAAGQPLEDPEDVSVTNSEVQSVMNHRRRKESVRHVVFFDQEFNAFNAVDAYHEVA